MGRGAAARLRVRWRARALRAFSRGEARSHLVKLGVVDRSTPATTTGHAPAAEGILKAGRQATEEHGWR